MGCLVRILLLQLLVKHIQGQAKISAEVHNYVAGPMQMLFDTQAMVFASTNEDTANSLLQAETHT